MRIGFSKIKFPFSSFLVATLLCLPSLQALAQEENNEAEEVKPTQELPAKQKKSVPPGVKKEKKAAAENSLLWPEWKPSPFGIVFQPVLGFQYSTDTKTDVSVGQAELGAYLGLRGIALVPGNPGMQIEPGIGYAVGKASINAPGFELETGNYQRIWGGLQTPIYYKFFRQVFAGRYGLVSGGPLEVSKRLMLQSDSAVAIIPYVSAHYTLTFERSSGKDSSTPRFDSYDHWLHGRLSSSVLNFFLDAGPGYSVSKLITPTGSASEQATSSGSYLLGVSGFDLFTDKIGMEAQAKYIFTSETEREFETPAGRSPLEDLGADSRRVGLPEDSFHASAFFGVKRLLGAFGIGWRYSLEILNVNERNNTKQSKTESNGVGVYASVRF